VSGAHRWARRQISVDLVDQLEVDDGPMGLAELVGPEREQGVRREIVEALAPYRRPEGSASATNSTFSSGGPERTSG